MPSVHVGVVDREETGRGRGGGDSSPRQLGYE